MRAVVKKWTEIDSFYYFRFFVKYIQEIKSIKPDSDGILDFITSCVEACWYPFEIGMDNVEVVKLILACHINCLRCLTEYKNGLGIAVSDEIIVLKRFALAVFSKISVYNGFL